MSHISKRDLNLQAKYHGMDWKGFWTRVERPFPSCSSKIHLPLLGSKRAIGDDCTCSPPESPSDPAAIDDVVSAENEWQSNLPSSTMRNSVLSELPRPAKAEGQTFDETHQESDDHADIEPREHESHPESKTREPPVVEYPLYKPERSAFKRIRRVHFSLELIANPQGSTDEFTDVVANPRTSSRSEYHEPDCMPNLKLDAGAKTVTSKLGSCSTFPVAPSRPTCGPWNYNFSRDFVKSRRHEGTFELENEPCTCNPSMTPDTNLPEPQEKVPNLASPVQQSEPPETSCYTLFCNIKSQAESLHDDTQKPGETPKSPATICPIRVDCSQDLGKWQMSNQPESSIPKMEQPLLPNDIHSQTSLRNCSALLSGLEPKHYSANNTMNLDKQTQHSRIAGIRATDSRGSCFENVADLCKNSQSCDVDMDTTRRDRRSDTPGPTHASKVAHKPHKEGGGKRTNSYPRARTPFQKFRKGGNKTPKSAYWFDVPYSSDADLPDGLLDRLQRRAATPDSEPVANVGNKISKMSYRVDEPCSADGLSQSSGITPDPEPVVDSVDNRTKNSDCFGVPYPADADLPDGLLQKGVATSDSEPAEDLGSNLTIKPSKRLCWFDMPPFSVAGPRAGLLQSSRELETPDSELTDADSKPSKGSCCFDVRPCSTDANVSTGLLQNITAIPHSEPAVEAGSKNSQSSCWLDVPNLADESAGLSQNCVSAPESKPAVDVGSKPSKTSYWSDVPYSTGANLPAGSLERGVATSDSEPTLKTSKSSYWFDVPYPTEADLPAWLSQRRLEARNSKPLANLLTTSKSSYWFDVPYTAEADLPAGLLQRLRVATPDIELSRRVEVDNKCRSTSVVGSCRLRRVNAQPEVRHRAVMTMSPTGKVYPGEFCPSFTLCAGDILMTRNLRTEQSLRKIGGYVTLFPDPRYFEDNGVEVAGSSGYYHFNPFDMVLRFGQFDDYDDWNWVPSHYFSLFMYAPPENSRSANGSWWLVDSKPSVALPAPDHNLDRELASMPLNSRYIRCFHLYIHSFRICKCQILASDGRKQWSECQVVYVSAVVSVDAFDNVKKKSSVSSFFTSSTTLLPPLISVDYNSTSPEVVYPSVVRSLYVTTSPNVGPSSYYANFGRAIADITKTFSLTPLH